ncbi:hypothetical protein FOA52_011793 [Chlamydomonas sp. UWO 241]|nr:hypothetical protein FOA52_011793 [Chlamydomonas sp. UWO 241]
MASASSCDADAIFMVFTACAHDVKTLILDVRPYKLFKREHVNQAFCVRVSADGKALVDYSQAKYEVVWSQGCWWGKDVILYGDSGLRRDNPVVEFLSREKQCRALHYYKDGFEALQSKFPHLATSSVKAGSIKRYPSAIVPGVLYLGDWAHAESVASLDEIGIRSIVTIHNHPGNLKLPSRFKHLKLELPDVEVADISKYFNQVYEFIEAARSSGHPALVHCGAGVSRSATLAMMYLMRRNSWPASRARAHTLARRSLVCVNDGFWRSLCALEAPLGLSLRSDPDDNAGTALRKAGEEAEEEGEGSGRAEPVALSADAAGHKVPVVMLTPAEAEITKAGGGGGGANGVFVTFRVSKPDTALGELRLGPMQQHQRCVFGRVPACDVVMEHLSVSRQHAVVTTDARGGVYVMDLGSAHGTKLDDVWIKPQTARQVRVGSVLVFGASTRRYKLFSSK